MGKNIRKTKTELKIELSNRFNYQSSKELKYKTFLIFYLKVKWLKRKNLSLVMVTQLPHM